MADSLQTLLNYIIEHRILQDESREAQIDATAVQDINAEMSKISADEHSDAKRLGPAFEKGLRAATNGTLRIDDTTPEGNAIADAFSRFLVRANLATSQSEPISDGHFTYTFEVDRPALHEIAKQAGVDLDKALAGDQNAG